MKKLAILALAATALVPPAAAQTAAPAARMSMPAARAAAPGVSWQHRAPMAPRVAARPHVRPPMAHPGRHVINRGHHRFVHRGHGRFVGRGPHHGPRFRHFRRFHRGFFIPPFFFAPQFHVMNWGLYGFAQPYGDQRWIRHYDDAYLIDGDGRVHDSRYGMDWDRHGERWDDDGEGPPTYGDESDYPPDEDYGRDEGHGDGRHGEHGGGHGGGHAQGGACQMTYGHDGPPPPPPPCAYGHGWGWGTMTVTETTTTTTTGPTVSHHSYEVEEQAGPKKMWRHKRKYRPAPEAPYGEKG
ncbi:MAG TPA: RcnB family protein [Allosphingosinicella sp.]|nr:RcnB family protein [Allosphingosinicella sp.]